MQLLTSRQVSSRCHCKLSTHLSNRNRGRKNTCPRCPRFTCCLPTNFLSFAYFSVLLRFTRLEAILTFRGSQPQHNATAKSGCSRNHGMILRHVCAGAAGAVASTAGRRGLWQSVLVQWVMRQSLPGRKVGISSRLQYSSITIVFFEVSRVCFKTLVIFLGCGKSDAHPSV